MQTLYLSRLQHYLFCPRQFALIELECAWAENVFTAEGQVMHEKVNSGGHDTRGNIKTVRTLPLGHRALGLEGLLMWSNITPMIQAHKFRFLSNTNAVSPNHIVRMKCNCARKHYA